VADLWCLRRGGPACAGRASARLTPALTPGQRRGRGRFDYLLRLNSATSESAAIRSGRRRGGSRSPTGPPRPDAVVCGGAAGDGRLERAGEHGRPDPQGLGIVA
jgi:hypothetical protein